MRFSWLFLSLMLPLAAEAAPPSKPETTPTLPQWTAGPGEQQDFEIGRNKAVIYGGAAGTARFYPNEALPAAFHRTLAIKEWPAERKGCSLEWIFTGPEGGFTVSITESSVRLAQRYYNSIGLCEIGGKSIKAGRHPEKKWIEDTVEYQGTLQAVTVDLGANLQVALRLNGREVLRQPCLFDVHQHQVAMLGGDGVLHASMLAAPVRAASVAIDSAKKYQTMIGFGGIGTPTAYAMLSPEGKQRWWELVAQYNLLIQREYPIGTRLNPAMDNWDRLTDATPHYYADNLPNGEMTDFGYIKTIRKLGGMVWFEFWGLPPWANAKTSQPAAGTADKKQKKPPRPPVDLDQYVRAVVGYCQASRAKVGVPPEVVGVQNEVPHPAEEYQQMTIALRRALDAAGFQDVKIHLSDDSTLKGGIHRAQAIRDSQAAWQATDYVASHVYDYQGCLEDIDKFDATIAQWNAVANGKPFLSTEICVNRPNYQVSSYRLAFVLGELYHKNLAMMDAQAICYCWTLLNVVQPSYGWTRSLCVPDVSRGGVPVASSNQLRVFGAFSRRIKRGMARIEAQCTDKDLLATAFQGSDGATIVLLNRGTSPCRVSIQGLSGLKEMEVADPYHENEMQPAPQGELLVSPGSVVTLTSAALGRLPEGFAIADPATK
jgi:O-glycosyl hydrolase